jgi:cytochrome P450
MGFIELTIAQCIGGQYAFMHLAATLGTASICMDWKHERTPDSDEIQVVAALVKFARTLDRVKLII